MASQDLKSRMHDVKPNQWLVFAASLLTLLAFMFSIGGLAGVWWAGTHERQIGRHSIKIVFAMTLWEQTVESGTEVTTKIDDECGKSELPEESESNCDKIGALRAFMFLKFFAVLPALVCPMVWLTLQLLRGDDASSSLQKHLLTGAIASKAFAFVCAFVATCIAPSLQFDGMSDEVGAGGAGYVLTILSMILCLLPAMILECFVWRKTYWLPSETTVETPGTKAVDAWKESSSNNARLPTVMGSQAASKNDAVKSQHASDLDCDPEQS